MRISSSMFLSPSMLHPRHSVVFTITNIITGIPRHRFGFFVVMISISGISVVFLFFFFFVITVFILSIYNIYRIIVIALSLHASQQEAVAACSYDKARSATSVSGMPQVPKQPSNSPQRWLLGAKIPVLRGSGVTVVSSGRRRTRP